MVTLTADLLGLVTTYSKASFGSNQNVARMSTGRESLYGQCVSGLRMRRVIFFHRKTVVFSL